VLIIAFQLSIRKYRFYFLFCKCFLLFFIFFLFTLLSGFAIHTRTHARTHTHAHTHARTHTHTHTHTHTRVHTRTHTRAYTHARKISISYRHKQAQSSRNLVGQRTSLSLDFSLGKNFSISHWA